MHPLSGATMPPLGSPSPCVLHNTPFSQPRQGQGGDAPQIPETTGRMHSPYGESCPATTDPQGPGVPSRPAPSTGLGAGPSAWPRACDKTDLGTSLLTVRRDKGLEPLARAGPPGDELPVGAKKNFFWITGCTKPRERYNAETGKGARSVEPEGSMLGVSRLLGSRPCSEAGIEARGTSHLWTWTAKKEPVFCLPGPLSPLQCRWEWGECAYDVPRAPRISRNR